MTSSQPCGKVFWPFLPYVAVWWGGAGELAVTWVGNGAVAKTRQVGGTSAALACSQIAVCPTIGVDSGLMKEPPPAIKAMIDRRA